MSCARSSGCRRAAGEGFPRHVLGRDVEASLAPYLSAQESILLLAVYHVDRVLATEEAALPETLRRHFGDTSETFRRHFRDTLATLWRHFRDTSAFADTSTRPQVTKDSLQMVGAVALLLSCSGSCKLPPQDGDEYAQRLSSVGSAVQGLMGPPRAS